MKIEIAIPAMGESVTEATISKFLKPEGAAVKENDEIVELETEKLNQVLYAPASGVLSWQVKEGDHVTIGANIGFVDSEGVPKEEKKQPPAPQKEKEEEVKPPPAKPSEGECRKMVPEFVREIKSPPQEEKEERAEAAAAKGDSRETRKPLPKIRKVIARRLVDALHTAAMLTTFNEADMSAVMDLRTKYKDLYEKKYGVKLGFMSFFVKAVVEGLKAFPELNSYIDGDDMVTRRYYDIGIAVGTDRGLVVPVVRNCDKLTFAEIEKEIATYAKKAREGGLTIPDLEGGGFTITNGGVYGSLLSTPILNPPQSGILGMHKIEKRPVVIDDQITIRPMMYLALSYDHRIVDGKGAVSFLVHLKESLEDPSRLSFIKE